MYLYIVTKKRKVIIRYGCTLVVLLVSLVELQFVVHVHAVEGCSSIVVNNFITF